MSSSCYPIITTTVIDDGNYEGMCNVKLKEAKLLDDKFNAVCNIQFCETNARLDSVVNDDST